MGEREVFDRINALLAETDYPFEIRTLADLEDFLNDDQNRDIEAFEMIGRLYDNLAYGDENDKYPEVNYEP